MSVKKLMWAGSVFLAFAVACNNTSENKISAGSPNTVKQAQPADLKKASTKKIVFVGQKESCPCTRKRIDKSWGVLQKFLAGSKEIPVQRLQLDVDKEESDRYDDMRSIMVAPGIFFMNEEGMLVEMIQGEVTESQIAAVLKK